MSLAIRMNGNNNRLLQIPMKHFENNVSWRVFSFKLQLAEFG